MKKAEQLTLLTEAWKSENLPRKKPGAKRKWENAFQKWSDEHGNQNMNEPQTESYGCCSYGSMCDWCEDNSYGRPCVRALNKMCREKRITIDYTNYHFEEIW